MKVQHSNPYRPDIEGLRGIAVLLVVAFHCGVPGVSGGFIGVDVFFVLSGYLITGLLVAEAQKTSRVSLLAFYARRIRRLLPASAMTLLVALLAGAVILAPNELQMTAQAARSTAMYMSNMFFASSAADYFAADTETNPMLHTWSLAVEEQFYLFWPLLIMLGFSVYRSKRGLAIVLSGFTVLSMAVCLYYTRNDDTSAFYGLPARAWEFGIGGVASLLPRGWLAVRPAFWRAVGWAGIAVVLLSGAAISSAEAWPGWRALIPASGTLAALIAGFEMPDCGATTLLNIGPLQFLGKLSYSWYLWHWPFLVFGTALQPSIGISGKIAIAGLALAVAALMHATVENPIRFHPYLTSRPGLCLGLAVALTAVSVGSSFAALAWSKRLERAPALQQAAVAIGDVADMQRDQCVTLGDSAEVRTCTYGSGSAATTVALFGDSHAIQWFNAIRKVSESRGWKLITFLKSGCPATDVAPQASDQAKSRCMEWRQSVFRQIAAARPSVVIVGSATIALGRKGRQRHSNRPALSLEEWRMGTERTLRALPTFPAQIVVMRDTPLPPFDVPTCLARSARHSWHPEGSCEMDRSSVTDAEVFYSEKAAAREFPNVHFLDMTDRLCGPATCDPVRNGVIVYRDDNHLTGRFSAALAPALDLQLSAILRLP